MFYLTFYGRTSVCTGSKSGGGDGTWCTVYVGNLAYKVCMYISTVSCSKIVMKRVSEYGTVCDVRVGI